MTTAISSAWAKRPFGSVTPAGRDDALPAFLKGARRLRVFTVSIFAPACFATLACAGPALADCGVDCLHSCDSQCYGTAGPYCRSGCMAACNKKCFDGRSQRQDAYGAVYVATDGGDAYGFSYGKRNQADAIDQALAECQARGQACQRLLLFVNRCATVVEGWRDGRVVGFSGAAETDPSVATSKAMAVCAQQYPGADCKVAREFCPQ